MKKTGKILHPVMNFATAFFTEKEIEDVAAYYKSLGKPAVTSPFFTIKDDDESKAVEAAASPAPTTPMMPYAVPGTVYPAPSVTYAAPGQWTAGY